MRDRLELQDIVLIGRTFDEYRRMFALDEGELRGKRLLDAASGVSSFCAEANERGWDVTASDVVYAFPADGIEAQCARDLDAVMAQMPPLRDRFVWDYFPDIEALRAHRRRAFTRFLADYRRHGTTRYVPVRYPAAPFPAGSFDLALVSHFLFLYDDRLDYAFHAATLRALLAAAREVRVFPIVDLAGVRSRHVTALLGDPAFAAYGKRVVPVACEFMRHGREMLVLRQD